MEQIEQVKAWLKQEREYVFIAHKIHCADYDALYDEAGAIDSIRQGKLQAIGYRINESRIRLHELDKVIDHVAKLEAIASDREPGMLVYVGGVPKMRIISEDEFMEATKHLEVDNE